MPVLTSLFLSSSANASVMVFSTVPSAPSAPPSMPPWPGSMTTVNRLAGSIAGLADPVALRRRNGRAGRLRLIGQRLLELASDEAEMIGDQPVALAVFIGDDVDLSTANGPFAVRISRDVPCAQRAVAHVADQPARLQRFGLDDERRFRQVDDQPVRPAQQEPFRIRLAVELHHDAHLQGVAGHLEFAGLDRRRPPSCRRRANSTGNSHIKASSERDAAPSAARSRSRRSGLWLDRRQHRCRSDCTRGNAARM